MEFRPCIDIHGGKVKQLIGGTISDVGHPEENYVSDKDASFYASLYKKNGLAGGHIIILDKKGTPEYEEDLRLARQALETWPDALQIGGGIDAENAEDFLEMGASHVIVTSYVFSDGKIRYDRLEDIKFVTGRKHLVLDLSVRIRNNKYYIVTDRWQKFTDVELSHELIRMLSYSCDEFLIHAVNVEGTGTGVDERLLELLCEARDVVITYAGGIASYDDIEKIRTMGRGNINFTVGSALDLFGGDLKFSKCIELMRA
ncbi:MAG: phosphoribosylformimino-5-aminoimidazole carboxamide ribotide isomerase [Eubacterium sp.]|nr:phosphoribosylformimino-5-aminoimidazole carboxamide ribotide isomerase [Eubacterium sp.]